MCSEAEMVGGNSHSIIVYTTISLLNSLLSENSGVITFFRFPPISKITVQLINSIQEQSPDPVVLGIRCMGKEDSLLQWERQLTNLLAAPLEKNEGSPVEQMLQMIEYIALNQWDEDCEPSVSILPVDDMY